MTINERVRSVRETLGLSQTAFGERLGYGRGVIKNVEESRTEVKSLLIDRICNEYKVDRIWLTTGDGNMYADTSRRDKIALFVGKALSDESDTFKADLLELLADMNADDWNALKVLARTFISAKTKKDGSE